MVYDFVAKIKNVKNREVLNVEALNGIVTEVNANFSDPLDLKFILPDADSSGEVLIKSQTSVSSMAALHDKELEVAVNSFIAYLEEIARVIDAEISKQDGFYNNSRTFKRLFN